MHKVDLSDDDIEMFGRAAVAALEQAVAGRTISSDQMHELYEFLVSSKIVTLVGEQEEPAIGEGDEESGEVERTTGAPTLQGGDEDAVSPPSALSPPVPSKPGTRGNPIRAETPEDIDRAGRRARRPTEAQAKAGNYNKGHLKVAGMDIAIETPKDGVRKGKDASGKSWRVKMPVHYGYVKKTTGADDDHVDIFLGPHVGSGVVFVIDQIDPETGEFDEIKTVLGARNEREARRFYAASFSDGKGRKRIGGITEMALAEFKDFLKQGGGREPLAA